ncbi:hypothetical protein NQ317_009938 [Molorchus minor]|uniref:R3H-associated N-terminal domain-containing protein n=1 Tax=Molorchus minor TaxID=1323400 RepID=A0ABQ9K895_9CUCU|nr:hypothetical protein NQ317_009938 [Molorchus minor]
MTVIRDKQSYNYPKPNSTTASDTESLHLGSASASDTESLNDEPHSTNGIGVFRPRPAKLSHVEEFINIKKSSGKKKIRRYQDRCLLQTLNEEDETGMTILMEPYKGPFARLLEDMNALDFWNTFIEKSQEEQTLIIKEFSEKYSHAQRAELKAVKDFEDDLIDFFKATPTEIYVRYPPTSFDRLILHAIAQYHRLKAVSMLIEDMGKRAVEVHNIEDNWLPADCFLTDFIKELRR